MIKHSCDVTDALWAYLIKTNFREQQQQQHKFSRSHQSITTKIKPAVLRRTSDIKDTKRSTTITTTIKRNGTNHQNLVLKEIVQELRRTMLTTSFGKSISKSNMTQALQGTASNTGSNHLQVTKREIVHALLELHTNPIYEHWVTLLDPNTMNPIVITTTAGVTLTDHNDDRTTQGTQIVSNHNDIHPNAIVQINHSISYQTIRKYLVSLL